jgi:hypothetical protein
MIALESDLVAAKLHSPRILNLNRDSRFNAGTVQVAATSRMVGDTETIQKRASGKLASFSSANTLS